MENSTERDRCQAGYVLPSLRDRLCLRFVRPGEKFCAQHKADAEAWLRMTEEK